MALATSNVQTCSFGPLKVTRGDWTGSQLDGSGAVSVAGGRVYLAAFSDQATDQPHDLNLPVSVSTSGSVTTVTVYYNQAVSTGRFLIIHA